MITIINKFFTEIMIKNYNRYHYFLNEPKETQGILYIFNHKTKKSKYSIMNYYIYSSSFVTKPVYQDMELLFYYSQSLFHTFGLKKLKRLEEILLMQILRCRNF